MILTYLRICRTIKRYPEFSPRDDLCIISSGILKNIGFVIVFGEDNKGFGYNFHVTIIPKRLDNVFKYIDKSVDAYLKEAIDYTIKKIEKKYNA